MATIQCAECGITRTHCPSNTKLCSECGLLRDLIYTHDKSNKCSGCGTQFAPMRRSDKRCSNCAFSVYRGTCVWCDTERAELIGKDIPICIRCGQDGPKRTGLIKAMRGRQDRRIAEHGVTV